MKTALLHTMSDLPQDDPQPARPAEQLGAEVAAAVVRELLRAWHAVNHSHFRGALHPPAIELHNGRSRLGEWRPATRSIAIAESLVHAQPWGVVLEVLKHEMVHQYVHEVLGRADEPAHGPTFRAVCERMQIDATPMGLPQPAAAPANDSDDGRDRAQLLRRISRLLALAESCNIHEAENAMREAQRLMLKYNLAVPKFGETPRARAYEFRHLGEPRRRIEETQRLLGMLLGKYFFVETIWVPSYDPRRDLRGSVLEICGTSENLEMAAYVHDFLTHTSERLWRDHKTRAGIRGDRERRTYLSGVMLGFAEQLAAQTQAQQQEGLIWRGDADLSHYMRRRHPHIRHIYGQGEKPRSAAHSEGRSAGRQIVLHRPIAAGPTASAPRALPPARSGGFVR